MGEKNTSLIPAIMIHIPLLLAATNNSKCHKDF